MFLICRNNKHKQTTKETKQRLFYTQRDDASAAQRAIWELIDRLHGRGVQLGTTRWDGPPSTLSIISLMCREVPR